MTSLVTIKRKVEELKQKVKPKPSDVVTVYMWTPSGEDPPYRGGRIRVKSLQKKEVQNREHACCNIT